jgi:hypothetical protein
MVVLAQKPVIVQHLCGGITWNEFCNDTRLSLAAMEHLLALLKDNVALHWEFRNETEAGYLAVQDVRLALKCFGS